MTISAIEPVGLYELSTESGGGLTVIDVREADEYAAVHAVIGANHPLSALSRGDLGFLAKTPREEALYVLCRSGQRSLRACGLLQDLGFANLVNITGGMLAWQAEGLPVVREGKV